MATLEHRLTARSMAFIDRFVEGAWSRVGVPEGEAGQVDPRGADSVTLFHLRRTAACPIGGE